MRNQFIPSVTNKGNGKIQEEANALMQNLSIVPFTNTSHTVATNESDIEFEVNVMKNMTDCDFYIPDESGDNTALAFRVAYKAATACSANDEKKLCTYVGAMLCSVVPGFRNSVEEALNGLGIRPCFVSLPSQAQAHKIVESEFPLLDWPSILVIFGYLLLLLFKIRKIKECENIFYNKMTEWISEMREKVSCVPSNKLNIPFAYRSSKENVIRTMIGSQSLRKTAITFLMKNFNLRDSLISSLCQYMSTNVLSWSGDLHTITLVNDMLVRTNSPVLSDSWVLAEVANFEKACAAISAHTYPHFFNHVCSVSELYYFDLSRFPTLIAVALELEKGTRFGEETYNRFSFKLVNDDSSVISGANRRKVLELLKIHWRAMAQAQTQPQLRHRFLIRGI